jgi:phosphoglucosamine mutase
MIDRHYFGTDGIRDIAGQGAMSAQFAFKVGMAAAETLKRHAATFADGLRLRPEAQPEGAGPTVVVGTDTRQSGSMLAHAVSAGLTARGANVLWLGVMTTPGVSYLTRQTGADAGVVISASHNPFEDNGIKLFNQQGEKLSDELERQIEQLLGEELADLPPVTGRAIGRSSRYRHESDDYAKFLLANAPYLDGLRVGLDCANGASFEIAPRVFQQLGARLDVINAKPDGSNINVASGSTHPQAITKRVLELGLEVGITFDGDADRAILVDKKGRLVTGDHMLAICAVVRHEKQVVSTVMANLGLEHYLAKRGIALLRTAVGDRYVFTALREHGLLLGGEQSGHLLFLDKAPTGDGILTALQTLAAARKSGKPLDAWLDEMPMYPQTIHNVRVAPEHKARIAELQAVQEAVQRAEAKLAGQGRINLRPSGTEPLIRVMVEGPDQAVIEAIAKDVAAVVERAG